MRDLLPSMVVLGALALGCGDQPSGTILARDQGTGLEGVVRRGPITPVCRVGEPCDAPFVGGFQVWQQHLVARFHTDSAGRYVVRLAPGAYTIVPDAGAPIWPQYQTLDVTVGPQGMTHADLDFDTGIR